MKPSRTETDLLLALGLSQGALREAIAFLEEIGPHCPDGDFVRLLRRQLLRSAQIAAEATGKAADDYLGRGRET